MAAPQIENGFSRIANELLEALARTRIPGEAMQILQVIIRKTYGFSKKQDEISLSQFNLATGIVKPSVVRAIKTLEAMRIIYKNANGNTTTYGINKDYSQWKPLAKKLTVSNNANKRLLESKFSFTKKLHTKERKKKEKADRKKTDPRIRVLTEFFYQSVVSLRDFKPNIDKSDTGLLQQRLKEISQEEIQGCIEYYLKSEKANKNGVTLKACISDHSINLYREHSKKGDWQYE